MEWQDPRLFKIGKTKGWDSARYERKDYLIGHHVTRNGNRLLVFCNGVFVSTSINDTSDATISAGFFSRAGPGAVFRMLPY